MGNTIILEFPSNLGLKEPSPGHEPGVRKLPAWLWQQGFYELIKPVAVHTIEPPPYSMQLDKELGVRNADAIGQYAIKQAEFLNKTVAEDKFIIAIGGDCSILIGVMLGLKQMGEHALFYIDGHHDFMLPSVSGTGGAAGMDLAIVTGYGHDKLTDLNHAKPYVKEDNIYCVGNREFDSAYVDPILQSAIHYVDLPASRSVGMKKIAVEFLEMVDEKNLEGYWIHLDVDVLNPEIMPCVDSPDPGGLDYAELEELLKPVLHHPKARGINITILDPELDPTGQYTKSFIHHFISSYER